MEFGIWFQVQFFNPKKEKVGFQFSPLSKNLTWFQVTWRPKLVLVLFLKSPVLVLKKKLRTWFWF
jgi:hypothetical protein